jgi:hydrophobe/amphiphile efflux-1 (HAE1) family protein
VAVSLIGTFAIMSLFGFTLNNLTLFGLVLAIGIVVDDAIVVLENIERWLGLGYGIREATIKAMDEITGPIIAITLVLCSVFLPSVIFIGGISGEFYRQFALTIAVAMILSAINAMTMTPARAASVFGHRKPGAHHDEDGREALPPWGTALIGGLLAAWLLGHWMAGQFGITVGEHMTWQLGAVDAGLSVAGAILGRLVARPVNRVLAILFRGFNGLFDRTTTGYGWLVGRGLRLSVIVLLVYGGLVGLTVLGFRAVPMGFIPDQDKGYLICNIQLPDSASLERTAEVMARLEKMALATPGVEHTVSMPGQSVMLGAVSSNFGSMFLVLKPFEERHSTDESASAVAMALNLRCRKEILDAQIGVFGAPPVDGLGNSGGFKLMIQDRGDNGLEMLQGQTDNLVDKGNQQPGLTGLFNSFRADTPQMYADIDRTKCKTLGVPLNDVFDTLQVLLGGYYVNDFNRFGRTWQVNAQADGQYRLTADTARQFKVRNADGQMVPLGALADIRDASGPVMINRYNMYPAAAINGDSLPGVSSGTVIQTMEALAQEQLAPSMTLEWTELTYLQKEAAGTAVLAFVGAVVLVFLVLAAQYESWSMPLAVILVVPMCILCALVGVAIARMDINIFVQVGFIVLVGLASKNAILVVEFARDRQKEGLSAFDATVQACKVRLRPIVMTSFAFILGVVPLVIATGAGAEMRRTLGVAVFSGMIGVTLFGIFLTPVFYYVIRWFAPLKPTTSPAGEEAKG